MSLNDDVRKSLLVRKKDSGISLWQEGVRLTSEMINIQCQENKNHKHKIMKQGDWKMLGCFCPQHRVMNPPLQRMVGKLIEITGMVALWGSTAQGDMTGSAYLLSNVTMVSGTIRFRAAKVRAKMKQLGSWGPTNILLSWQLGIYQRSY